MMAERESDNRRAAHRTAPSPGVGALAALEGAALIVWNLVATPLIGRRRLRWGTVGTEASDSLPGDEFVAEPKWSYTLGVSIDASRQDVWPWIAQIGQGRGGFYTYQTLENLVGCKITNTTEVLPDHQHPAVDGEIFLHPTAPPMRIEIVDPPHALVLFGSPADAMAQAGLGIALVPRLGRTELASDLAAVEVAVPVPTRDIVAIHRRTMDTSPAIRAILDALKAASRTHDERPY